MKRWQVLTMAVFLAGTVAGATGSGCGGDRGGTAGAAQDTTLSRMLEELVPAMERSSGLEALSTPRVATSDAETLGRYLTQRFNEQLPEETASALTAVYARFGLVPDTLDLRRTLLALYKEQVVGYYDPRVDTLFVLGHVPAAQLELVLAHELVHALQDQHVDLDSLVKETEGDNDRAAAVQAVVEGHAMLAMLEWYLRRMAGHEVDITTLPDLGGQLAGVDLAALGEASLPALKAAPRIIQQELIFPYEGGLSFVQKLWQVREGRPAPFGANLPSSSEQILHPLRFLGPEPDEPSEVRFTADPPSGWRVIRSDTFGEMEMKVFLEVHLADPQGADEAAEAAAGWDGDRYRLLRGPKGEALIWATVWDSDADAEEFETAVREAFLRRYAGNPEARVVHVEKRGDPERPGVLILDLPAGLAAGAEWVTARYGVRVR